MREFCRWSFFIGLQVAEQLRGERYLVRFHIPELHFFKNVRSQGFYSKPIGSSAIQLFSWGIIDMIHTFPDVPLCQTLKNGAFRQDHPQHGMDIFNSRFLAAAHGITVKDTGTGGYRQHHVPKHPDSRILFSCL